VADETQEAKGQEAPHPADKATAAGGESAGGAQISVHTLVVLAITVALYAGTVFASSGFTEKVVVPKLSTWLVAKEARRLAEEVEAKEIPPFGEVYVIEDLVVNPAHSGGMRYLCASVGLESDSPEIIQEIALRDAQIKDCLIQILGSKTVDELAAVGSRERVRQEIRARIEEILPEPGLDAVYFVNFVLQ